MTHHTPLLFSSPLAADASSGVSGQLSNFDQDVRCISHKYSATNWLCSRLCSVGVSTAGN
ncbi:hypothetical protein PR003_g13156 [Phytophthora rubi]|uniref:Uncharacterized protein n=1 Tax=Phytophthora rubi TaxID=129364 RepID=A0A6A3LAA0_9STRA|nr:hypothetical protein PR002_g14120 [Phytophthora rubi]KAE9018028.1 hypothetical protein PR001_g14245 [Phytophthora rubi]KAE9335159.1 hypothetical protein PR003_g13156 [Phytophthora rubi]